MYFHVRVQGSDFVSVQDTDLTALCTAMIQRVYNDVDVTRFGVSKYKHE